MSDQDELAQIEAELKKRGGGGSDELGQVEAELAKREQQASGPRAYAMSAAKKLLPLVIPGGAGLKLGEALDHAGYKVGEFASDVASHFLPAGGAAGVGAAANVATQSIPMLLGGGIGAKAAPLFEAAGKGLMQSAIKPTIAQLRTGKADKAIQTMLDEGINVSKGGMEALSSRVGELNAEIKTAIGNSTASIDKNAVASRVNDVLDKFIKQVDPSADIAAITAVRDRFLDHPLLRQAAGIPVQLAQQIKQGTYKVLGSKSYGEVKAAETEAQKAIARGLKEEIAGAVPSVGKPNARESELLNAMEVAGRRVMMDGNKNPLGLGWLHPETALAWAADRSPVIKSLLARGAYSGAEAIPRTAGQAVGASAGAWTGRRLQDEEVGGIP